MRKRTRTGGASKVCRRIADLRYSDIVYHSADKHRLKFLGMLQPKQVAILIQELDPPMQIDKPGVQQSSNIMDLMETDDLADLLNQLSAGKIEEFLAAMRTEESNSVKDFMRYPPVTAGGS